MPYKKVEKEFHAKYAKVAEAFVDTEQMNPPRNMDSLVRVAALRGSILPDPIGGKEPEYFL